MPFYECVLGKIVYVGRFMNKETMEILSYIIDDKYTLQGKKVKRKVYEKVILDYKVNNGKISIEILNNRVRKVKTIGVDNQEVKNLINEITKKY